MGKLHCSSMAWPNDAVHREQATCAPCFLLLSLKVTVPPRPGNHPGSTTSVDCVTPYATSARTGALLKLQAIPEMNLL
jgi:hypothetical protein